MTDTNFASDLRCAPLSTTKFSGRQIFELFDFGRPGRPHDARQGAVEEIPGASVDRTFLTYQAGIGLETSSAAVPRGPCSRVSREHIPIWRCPRSWRALCIELIVDRETKASFGPGGAFSSSSGAQVAHRPRRRRYFFNAITVISVREGPSFGEPPVSELSPATFKSPR